MVAITEKKMLVYGAIAVGGLGMLISLFGGTIGSLIGGLLAGLGALFAILFMKYGYILMPLITERTGTVIMTDTGFEIPPRQDVVVKNVGGVYYASAFLGIKIFESATEKTLDENIAYNEYFERAISNLKNVTKIAYMVYVEDISKKRRDIEAKRAEAQLRLARERDKGEPDVLKIDKFEREVAVWDNELNKLIKGVKPMGVVAYAMTTAVGVSKDAAMAAAKAQANELRTVLANALNVEVELLTGDEMLKCFEWEKFMPVTAQDLEESMV